ncbi:hypothetical protein [Rhizobium phaseoli]|uniref:hypothetical protein n=1 Tax=Rhizobium phaseoli TaxID=396 RepID=UPI001FE1E447|nr:hypothetical protein [Rhizobium phaseoli]
MKTVVAAAVRNFVVALCFIALAVPVHAAVPCEEMFKNKRAAKAFAKLSDANMKKVEDLRRRSALGQVP